MKYTLTKSLQWLIDTRRSKDCTTEVSRNMREKYVPSRFCIARHVPSKITAQLFEAKDGKTLTAGKWKRLTIPNYFDAAIFNWSERLQDYTNGISVDSVKLLYNPVDM